MYSTRQVAELLNVPVGQVRQYARSGFVSPSKDDHGAYQFGFQDLILLRTAVGLVSSNVPHRRVRNAFLKIKQHLPEDRALTEVRVAVVAGSLMAQDGETVWSPDSGQLHMNFDEEPVATTVTAMPVEPDDTSDDLVDDPEQGTADQAYQMACDAEARNPLEAIEAYRRALALDPEHSDAHINLGRLLHRAGNVADAIGHYRAALRARPASSTAWFNMGIALEETNHVVESIDAYKLSIDLDPEFPDPHYNLASLYEKVGDTRAALRHFKAFKNLIRPPAR